MNKSNWIPPQLQSSRASPNTRCQKCLQYGHFSYNCKSARPYVARTSRTKQLAEAGDLPGGSGELYGRNKSMGKPSVEVPDEFRRGPAGVGLADEILKAKEEARKRLGIKEPKKGKRKEEKKKSRKRSPTPSSDSDSDSDSSSSSSSSRTPPPRTKRRYSSTPPRTKKEEPRRRSPSPRRRRRSTSTPRSRSPVKRRPVPERRSRSRS